MELNIPLVRILEGFLRSTGLIVGGESLLFARVLTEVEELELRFGKKKDLGVKDPGYGRR